MILGWRGWQSGCLEAAMPRSGWLILSSRYWFDFHLWRILWLGMEFWVGICLLWEGIFLLSYGFPSLFEFICTFAVAPLKVIGLFLRLLCFTLGLWLWTVLLWHVSVLFLLNLSCMRFKLIVGIMVWCISSIIKNSGFISSNMASAFSLIPPELQLHLHYFSNMAHISLLIFIFYFLFPRFFSLDDSSDSYPSLRSLSLVVKFISHAFKLTYSIFQFCDFLLLPFL